MQEEIKHTVLMSCAKLFKQYNYSRELQVFITVKNNKIYGNVCDEFGDDSPECHECLNCALEKLIRERKEQIASEAI